MLIILFISPFKKFKSLQNNSQIMKISLNFFFFISQKAPINFLFLNQKKEALAYGLKHDVFIFLFLCKVDTQVAKHKLAVKQLIIYFSFLIFI